MQMVVYVSFIFCLRDVKFDSYDTVVVILCSAIFKRNWQLWISHSLSTTWLLTDSILMYKWVISDSDLELEELSVLYLWFDWCGRFSTKTPTLVGFVRPYSWPSLVVLVSFRMIFWFTWAVIVSCLMQYILLNLMYSVHRLQGWLSGRLCSVMILAVFLVEISWLTLSPRKAWKLAWWSVRNTHKASLPALRCLCLPVKPIYWLFIYHLDFEVNRWKVKVTVRPHVVKWAL